MLGFKKRVDGGKHLRALTRRRQDQKVVSESSRWVLREALMVVEAGAVGLREGEGSAPSKAEGGCPDAPLISGTPRGQQ